MKILVPYRDRSRMLKAFVPWMMDYLPTAEIIIIEQADDKPFNRAKLINVGFLETTFQPNECFVSHDIDLLPKKVNYDSWMGVKQMASNPIQIKGYLSGCTMFDQKTFQLIGGYHNEYFHRAEDNEMMFNLFRLGIPVHYDIGEHLEIVHERPKIEFDPILWRKAQL